MPRTALLIIAQQGYQDVELQGTRDGLTEAGFEIVLASKEAGPCAGKLGGKETANLALRDVKVNDYDRIAFIGGPGMAKYADDQDAVRVANEAARSGRPLGAICIAPTILAKARVLENKKATVFGEPGGSEVRLLAQYQAIYTGDEVTVDGQIVTANGPKAAKEFGRTLASM